MSSPNRDALIRLVDKLGPLARELVFVGGRVAELLVTDPGATRVRPTNDSDAVVEVTGKTGYYRFGNRLRDRGFVEDNRPGAPVCRWRSEDDVLDVLPVDGSVLGFRNAWYGHVRRESVLYELMPGMTVSIASAPAFLATKWDAFHDRAQDDWYGSHDLEDIVTVVAGRPEVPEEIADTGTELREYLISEANAFVESGMAEAVIAGALPDARTVPGLVDDVLQRFGRISGLALGA